MPASPIAAPCIIHGSGRDGCRPQADAGFGRRFHGNSSPGSSLRSGAMSECATMRFCGIGQRERMPWQSSITAAICASGKRPVAPLMAGVHDLDADRARVEILIAPPPAAPRLPGALVFGHQREHPAVFLDHVMGRDARLLVLLHAGERRRAVLHAGIVQHQHVERVQPLVEVGARGLDDRQDSWPDLVANRRLREAPVAAHAR